MMHNERQIVEKYLIKYNAKINQNFFFFFFLIFKNLYLNLLIIFKNAKLIDRIHRNNK